jgi:sugar phosphate isomerase/epimerase
MAAKPISVQLYSLRQECEQDFVGVLTRLAEIGYTGVEPAGFYDLSVPEFKKVIDDLGLVVSSSHRPWCTPAGVDEAIDAAGELGLDILACGYGPDDFADKAAIEKTAADVNVMVDKLAAAGLKLMQHNHAWEFERLEDGTLKYDLYKELCPGVQFELDMYWACNFGAEDPAAWVKANAARIPYLHVKDGPLVPERGMTASGQGKVDLAAVINAADPEVLRWLVVELDHCETDMFTAIEESYKYLVGQGLASGNKAV